MRRASCPVPSLVELSLQSNFRRGHGALYDALARGAVDQEWLRALSVDQLPDGPAMFGVDASTFLGSTDLVRVIVTRPDAPGRS